jgi:hypothetical protein
MSYLPINLHVPTPEVLKMESGMGVNSKCCWEHLIFAYIGAEYILQYVKFESYFIVLN